MSVIFEQLRISDDGKRMYINLHVNRAEYFDNIFLDSITIVAADKVSETSPDVPSSDFIYRKLFGDSEKQADLVLTPADFNEHFRKGDFSSDLFFVYVKVKGIPDACTPCRLDEQITLGVTFDENMFHQLVMQHTRELSQTCKVTKGFLDLILLWNGFKSAIETEHYIQAIDFWKKIFGNRNGLRTLSTTKPCGCNG